MNYTTYDPATGMIIALIFFNDEQTADANLQGHHYIEGAFGNDYYVENGQAIQMPAKPSDDHVFDYETKTWILDQSIVESKIRLVRNELLKQIDVINPVWYSALAQDQQAELVAYRQQLLDVPQQSGFPTQVEWPAKPAWL